MHYDVRNYDRKSGGFVKYSEARRVLWESRRKYERPLQQEVGPCLLASHIKRSGDDLI